MEGVLENEPNTIEIKVDSAMTKEEVVNEIIKRVEKLTSWIRELKISSTNTNYIIDYP